MTDYTKTPGERKARRVQLEADGIEAPTCPRCGGFIPSNERPGQYPGALSRADNETEVCSACGQEEALHDYFSSLARGKES